VKAPGFLFKRGCFYQIRAIRDLRSGGNLMRMKILAWFVIGIVAADQVWAASEVSAAGVLSEEQWRELATKRNCLLCHEMGPDALGPSLKDIASEYAGDADAERILMRKVYEGGVGKWGTTVMPSQSPPASPDEIKALLRYMLLIK
jgi:cytochrome c